MGRDPGTRSSGERASAPRIQWRGGSDVTNVRVTMDPAPGVLDTQSLNMLRRALDRLAAGFAGLPPSGTQLEDAAGLERVLLDVAPRPPDNLPYLHPPFPRPMLKPPPPPARLPQWLPPWVHLPHHHPD